MSEPEPETKVVGIVDGKPVEVLTTTSPQIMNMIEELRATAAGEKHLAIGVFIVDELGRPWIDFRCEANWPGMVGAATLLQHRIIAHYEQGIKGA